MNSQTRKRYEVCMQNAEEADERDRKRARTSLSGGQLFPLHKLRQLYQEGLNPFPSGSYNPEPEILYINGWVSGGLAVPIAGDPMTAYPPALINRNFDKVLLRRPCDYRLAITRVQLPLTSVPLFLYPLGSCTVGCGTMVEIIWPTYGNWRIYPVPVVPISIDPNSDIAPGKNPNYPNGAIAIWSVQQFVDAINAAINTSFITLFNDLNVLVSASMAPIVSWEPTTQLFSVSFESNAWYGGPDYLHWASSPPLPTAPPAGKYTWPIQYPQGTCFLFSNSTLHDTYFPGISSETTAQWLTGFDNSPTPGATAPGAPGTEVCWHLNDQLYAQPAQPIAGPPMALTDVPPAYPAGSSFITRQNRVGGGELVTWTNPAIPHGLRPGDPVVVAGATVDPTLNQVYMVQSISDTDLSTNFDGYVSFTHKPQAKAWSWQAVDQRGGPTGPKYGPGTATPDPRITMYAVYGSKLMGNWSSVTSMSPAMHNWNDGVMTIRVSTYSLPIRQQLLPQLNSASGLETRPIVTDIVPADRNLLNPRDGIVYQPSPDNYYWIELLGEEPLYTFSLVLNWTDSFGSEYPIYVGPGEVFEAKAVFQRKDCFTRATC
jgi:hypothetical protein